MDRLSNTASVDTQVINNPRYTGVQVKDFVAHSVLTTEWGQPELWFLDHLGMCTYLRDRATFSQTEKIGMREPVHKT